MIEVKGDQVDITDAMCPTCKKFIASHKCRFCGAVRTVNNVSGNVIWMKNGRVVKAYNDSKAAFLEAAKTHDIPKELWPEEFK